MTARQIERVRKVMARAGHEKFAKRALALARPAVSIAARRAGRAKLAPGTSKLGGLPDLPPGVTWPKWKRQPLAFLAQVNLAEVARYASCRGLPRQGLLQFFYDARQRAWGANPEDRGAWRVLYHEEVGKPARAPGIKPSPACRLQLRETTTLISGYSYDYEQLDAREAEHEAYGKALVALEDGGPVHQLLGNAAPIQGDMELECQLAANGIHCGDPTVYESRRAKKLAPGAARWRLLFQLDSDDRAGLMWGDAGRLYFWITDEALGAGRFEESWVVLQSF